MYNMGPIKVEDQPLDLRVGLDTFWANYPRHVYPQPIHVPPAGPSPRWTPACRPDLRPSGPESPAPRALPTSHAFIIPQPSTSPQLYVATNGFLSGPRREREDDDSCLSDDSEYQQFKTDALHVMAEKNGGWLVGHNPRMRREVQSRQGAGESYRSRRQRNNLAAKQSRDRRKLRELDAALKVSFLSKRLARAKALLAARECTACRRREI